MPSIVVSFFSVSAAICMWLAMIAVDAAILRRRKAAEPRDDAPRTGIEYQYSTLSLFEQGGPEDGLVPPMPGCGCPHESPVEKDGVCWRW